MITSTKNWKERVLFNWFVWYFFVKSWICRLNAIDDQLFLCDELKKAMDEQIVWWWIDYFVCFFLQRCCNYVIYRLLELPRLRPTICCVSWSLVVLAKILWSHVSMHSIPPKRSALVWTIHQSVRVCNKLWKLQFRLTFLSILFTWSIISKQCLNCNSTKHKTKSRYDGWMACRKEGKLKIDIINFKSFR